MDELEEKTNSLRVFFSYKASPKDVSGWAMSPAKKN